MHDVSVAGSALLDSIFPLCPNLSQQQIEDTEDRVIRSRAELIFVRWLSKAASETNCVFLLSFVRVCFEVL